MKKPFTFSIILLVLFAFTQAASALVYTVTVPVTTNEVYIAGDFSTNAWSPKDRKLTRVDDTHFTIDIAEATTANKYKYCSGPDWVYVEKSAAGADITNRTFTDGNDVVANWFLLYNPTVVPLPKKVTVNVTVPVDVLVCYIVGNFNNWTIPTDSTRMTLLETTAAGKVYSVSFFTSDANKLQYKFCAGPSWDYASTSLPNLNYPNPALDVSNEVVSSFTAYYNPATANTINITATVPLGTDRVWIQGNVFGWDWTQALEAIKVSDGLFNVAVPVSTSPYTMQYLMFNQPDLEHYEVDETGLMRTVRTATYPNDTNVSITVTGWTGTLNAVTDINKDKYKIYVQANAIVVEGIASQVDIYDLCGRNIQSSKAASKFISENLNTGVYIVKIDGYVKKVFIKY